MVIIDFILHCDEYIVTFINNYGNLVYFLLFAIIFCETGLVFLPFLPGDSLIFVAGTFASIGDLSFFLLLILILSAAVIGDTVNYEIGKHFGRRLLNNKKFTIVKEDNLQKADDLIAKYGSAAIFIARFIPIVRTIVPFVVGMGRLDYKKFLTYNVIGGVTWVTLFLTLGYFFGNIPIVADNLSLIIIGIIFLSVIPIIISFIKNKFKKKKA